MVVFVYFSILIYTTGFTIIGFILPPKKFKNTKNKYKYAFLIPARNEEQTIGQLIQSIKAQDYPGELISIFVVAHNCTDDTAKIALEAGATVYEWNNPKKARKGYALNALLLQIKKDFATQEQPNGILNFDGYFVFDADNLLTQDYVTEMNKAFNNKKYAGFTSYSISKNLNNVFATLTGIQRHSSLINQRRAKSHLLLATSMDGPGYLVRSHIFSKGFQCTSLTEDFELLHVLTANGHRVTYCEAGKFYEEHPLSLRIVTRQRLRWSRGAAIAYFKTFPFLLLGIIAPYHNLPKGVKKPRRTFLQTCENEIMKRISSAELVISHLPIWILTFITSTLYPILFFAINAFTGNAHDIWEVLFPLILLYSSMYVNLFITYALVIIREHRKIKVHPLKLVWQSLFLPLLTIATMWISFFAILWPVKWKPIPHVIDKTINDCEKEKTLAQYIYEKKGDT